MTIIPVDKTALSKKLSDVEGALDRLESIPCDSADVRAFFNECMNKAHTESKTLTEERQELTRPDKARIEETEASFRPVLKALEKLKVLAKAKVSQYDTERALEANTLRQKAIEAAQADKPEECGVLLAAIPQDVATAFEWVFMMTEADLVPRELCEPSPSRIKAKALKYKGSETIPSDPGGTWERRATVRVSKPR